MAEDVTETFGEAERQPAQRRRRLRRGVSLLSLVVAAGIVAVAVGFFGFVNAVTEIVPGSASATADGIVVFTGGKDRIAEAARLLSAGRGKRLLISGVNPTTTRADLEDAAPEIERLSACCIDLGREAEDTIGNAEESAAWARQNGFASLLVVTSSYHLPRSLSELSAALPEVALTGVPVTTGRLRRPWWRDRTSVRLLLAEYGKYLASQVRQVLSGGAARSSAGG